MGIKESHLGVTYPRGELLFGARLVKELDTTKLLATEEQVLVVLLVVVFLSPLEQVVVHHSLQEKVVLHHSQLEEALLHLSPLEQVVVVHSRKGKVALHLVLQGPKDIALSYLFKAM
jgi:hypothetical protein